MNPQKAFDFAQHFDPSEFIAQPQPPTPVQQELQRRSANYFNVLDQLKLGPATNVQLTAVGGMRFGARIWELREDGAVIQKDHVKGGLYSYRMLKEPTRKHA